MRYTITTAYGNKYICDKDGYVLEYSNGLKKNPNSESRKTWQITGGWCNIGFGYIRYISLAKLAKVDNIRLKNGQPRYGLTDIDHNTQRLHGNKDYHGVTSCQINA